MLCGAKHRIIRKGRNYVSIAYFCGRWDCPRCGKHFKARWVHHLTNLVGDQPVYTLHCTEDDWGRIRRGINRLGANYAKVRDNSGFLVILDKSYPDAEPLKDKTIQCYLEDIIPAQTDQCPISTSRGWDRTKNNVKESECKAVTTTWLTVEDQVAIAERLGAERHLFNPNQWQSPVNVDEDEWEYSFVVEIKKKEQAIKKDEDDKRRAFDKAVEVKIPIPTVRML